MKHDHNTPQTTGLFRCFSLPLVILTAALIGAVAAVTTPQAFAQATETSSGSGSFTDGANWTGGTVPGPGIGTDNVTIDGGDVLELTGGTTILIDRNFNVGLGGSGTLTVNGGTIQTHQVEGIEGQSNRIGSGAGNVGSINIVSGLLEFGGDETTVGHSNGTGVIDMTGGILFINGDVANSTFEIGGSGDNNNVAGTGVVNVGAGALVTTNANVDVVIGGQQNSSGTLILDGGDFRMSEVGNNDDFFISNEGDAYVEVRTGSTLRIDDALFIGRNNNVPGVEGSAHLFINGGQVFADDLLMSQANTINNPGGMSTLTLGSGLLDIDNSVEIGGDSGFQSNTPFNEEQAMAFFFQNGGTFLADANLIIGNESSQGIYSMNGGFVDVGNSGGNDLRLIIGNSSQNNEAQSLGSMTVSGGTVMMNLGGDDEDIYIGNSGAAGFLRVDGTGVVMAQDDLEIGLSEQAGYQGTGVMVIDGSGLVDIEGEINIGSQSDSIATVIINSGLLDGRIGIDVSQSFRSRGVLLVNGGTVEGNDGGTLDRNFRIATSNDSTGIVSVNGGVIISENDINVGVGLRSMATLFVNDGLVAAGDDILMQGDQAESSIVVTGGTLEADRLFMGYEFGDNEATAASIVDLEGGLIRMNVQGLRVGANGEADNTDGVATFGTAHSQGIFRQTGGTFDNSSGLTGEASNGDLFVGVNGGEGLFSLNGGLFITGRDNGTSGSNDEINIGNDNRYDNNTEVGAGAIAGVQGGDRVMSSGTMVVSGGTFNHQGDGWIRVGNQGHGVLIIEGGVFSTNVGKNDATNDAQNHDIIIANSEEGAGGLGTSSGHLIIRGTGALITPQTDIEMNNGNSELTVDGMGTLTVQAIRQSNSQLNFLNDQHDETSTINFIGGVVNVVGTVSSAGMIQDRGKNDATPGDMTVHNSNINYSGTILNVADSTAPVETSRVTTGSLTIGAANSVDAHQVASATVAGEIGVTRVFTETLTLGQGAFDAGYHVDTGRLTVNDGIGAGGSGASTLTVGANGTAGGLTIRGIAAHSDTGSEIDNFTLGAMGNLTANLSPTGINAIEADQAVFTTGSTLTISTTNLAGSTRLENSAIWTGGNGLWDATDTNWNALNPAGGTIVAAGGTLIIVQAGATGADYSGGAPTVSGGAGLSLSTAGGAGGHLGVVTATDLVAGQTVATIRGASVTVNQTDGLILSGNGNLATADAAGLVVESDATLTILGGVGSGDLHVGQSFRTVDGPNEENGSVYQEGNVLVGGNIVFGLGGTSSTVNNIGGTYYLNGGSLKVDGLIGEAVSNNDGNENALFIYDAGTIDVAGDISVLGFHIGSRTDTDAVLTINSGQQFNVNGELNADDNRLIIGQSGSGGLVVNGGDVNVGVLGNNQANNSGIQIAAEGGAAGSLVLNSGSIVVNQGGIRASDAGRNTSFISVGTAGGGDDEAVLWVRNGDVFLADSNNSRTVFIQESGVVSISDDRLVLSDGSANQVRETELTINGGIFAIEQDAGFGGNTASNSNLQIEEGSADITLNGGSLIVGNNIVGHNDVGGAVTSSDGEALFQLNSGLMSVGNGVSHRNGNMRFFVENGATLLVGNDFLGSANTNTAHANNSSLNIDSGGIASIGGDLTMRQGEQDVEVNGGGTLIVGGVLNLADPLVGGNNQHFRLSGSGSTVSVGSINHSSTDSDLLFRFDNTVSGLSQLSVSSGDYIGTAGVDLTVDDAFAFNGDAVIGSQALWGGSVGTWEEPTDNSGWDVFNPGTATLASGASFTLVETLGGTIDTSLMDLTDSSTGGGTFVTDNGVGVGTLTYTTTADLNRGLTRARISDGTAIRESDLLIAHDSFTQAATNGTDASDLLIDGTGILSLTGANNLQVGSSNTGGNLAQNGGMTYVGGSLLVHTNGNANVDINEGLFDVGGDLAFIGGGGNNRLVDVTSGGTLIIDGNVDFATGLTGTSRIWGQIGSVTSIGGNIIRTGSVSNADSVYIDVAAEDFVVSGGTIDTSLFRIAPTFNIANETAGYLLEAGGLIRANGTQDAVFYIGQGDVGILSQTGGVILAGTDNNNTATFHGAEDIRVATDSENTDGSSWIISGGLASAQDDIYIGNVGDALLDMSGGTIYSNDAFFLAANYRSTSTLLLSDGLIESGPGGGGAVGQNGQGAIQIGVDGHGTLVMSGGTMFANGTGGDYIIGVNVGEDIDDGTGVVLLSGGLIEAYENVIVGSQGTGILSMNGGTVHANGTGGDFQVGDGALGAGTVFLSGGLIDVEDFTYIGDNGQGYFMQTGGTAIFRDDITFGQASPGSGTGVFSGGLTSITSVGGSLTGNSLYVGGTGRGHMIVNGGTVISTGEARIANANNAATSGLFEMSDGFLHIQENTWLGDGANQGGTANFTGGTAIFGRDTERPGDTEGQDDGVNFRMATGSSLATANMNVFDGAYVNVRGDFQVGNSGTAILSMMGGLLETGTIQGIAGTSTSLGTSPTGNGTAGTFSFSLGAGATGNGTVIQTGGTIYSYDETSVVIGDGATESVFHTTGGLFQVYNGSTVIIGNAEGTTGATPAGDRGVLIVDGGTFNANGLIDEAGETQGNILGSFVVGNVGGNSNGNGAVAATGIVSVNSGELIGASLLVGQGRSATSSSSTDTAITTGITNISGGIVTLYDDLVVGNHDDTYGSLNISGGLVAVGNFGNDDFVVGAQGSRREDEVSADDLGADNVADFDGIGATGEVTISGGTTLVNSNWTLGSNLEFTAAGSNSQGGSANTHNTLAQAPRALVNMTGGLVVLGVQGGVDAGAQTGTQGVLNVGRDSLAAGTRHSMATFNMSGGTLEVQRIALNSDASNTFNFTGGMIRATTIGGNTNMVLQLVDADQPDPKFTIQGGTLNVATTGAGDSGNIGDNDNVTNIIEITSGALINALNVDANIEQSGGLVHFSENHSTAVDARLIDTVNLSGTNPTTANGTQVHDFTGTGGTAQFDLITGGADAFSTIVTNGGTLLSTDLVTNGGAVSADRLDAANDSLLADAIDFTGTTIKVTSTTLLTTGMTWDLVDWNTFSTDALNANTGSWVGGGAGGTTSMLADSSGAFTFDFSMANLDTGSYFAFNLWDSDGVLYILPEPSRILLQLIGLGYFVLRRRRKIA